MFYLFRRREDAVDGKGPLGGDEVESSSAFFVESIVHVLGGLVALSELSLNLVLKVEVLAVVVGADVQGEFISRVLDVKVNLVFNAQLGGVLNRKFN